MSKWVYDGWDFPSIKADPPRERFLKLISCPQTTGYERATVLFAHIPPKSTSGPHVHAECDEVMHIVGRGEIIIDEETVQLETDSVIIAPQGIKHECRNTSETETLKIFCVYIPPINHNDLLASLADRTKRYLQERS